MFGEREDGHYKSYRLVFPKQQHDTKLKELFIKLFAARLVCCMNTWGKGQGKGVDCLPPNRGLIKLTYYMHISLLLGHASATRSMHRSETLTCMYPAQQGSFQVHCISISLQINLILLDPSSLAVDRAGVSLLLWFITAHTARTGAFVS